MREVPLFTHARLKSGQNYIILVREEHLTLLFAFLAVAVELKNTQRWHPLSNLLEPLSEGDLGHDHDVVAESVHYFVWFFQTFDESYDRNGLNSLAKTHLIGQDTVEIRLIQPEQPVQSLQLVVLQLAADYVLRLCIQLVYLKLIILLLLRLVLLNHARGSPLTSLLLFKCQFGLVFNSGVYIKIVVISNLAIADFAEGVKNIRLSQQFFKFCVSVFDLCLI